MAKPKKYDCPHLPKGASMQIVQYFSGPPTQPGDHKCNGDHCHLKGWLYIPADVAAHRKAVVFVHGHNQHRKEPSAIASHFLRHGYVVFAPLRSGNTAGKKTDPKALRIHNSGKYIETWVGDQLKLHHGTREEDRVKYLRDYQKYDVGIALHYLAGLRDSHHHKLVHEGRIGLLGQSYGGSLVVFCSGGEFKVNPRAIADISGGELSWKDGGPWEKWMCAAVRKRKVPIYFLQPRNGKSIRPTIVLSHEAAKTGDRQFEATIFPPIKTKKKNSKYVHDEFVDNCEEVDQWGPSVRNFFERYFAPLKP